MRRCPECEALAATGAQMNERHWEQYHQSHSLGRLLGLVFALSVSALAWGGLVYWISEHA